MFETLPPPHETPRAAPRPQGYDRQVLASGELPPGVERLAILSRIDVHALSVFERIDVLALWEQCQSWLAAGQAEAMAALAGHGDWSTDQERAQETARVTLAAAGPSPRRNPFTALALTHHPLTADRLRAGLVSYEQVHAVLTEVAGCPLDVARTIADDLLTPDAATTTPAELRREARRRVAASDPTKADLEAEREVALRQVRRRSFANGRSELTVCGPADKIATIWTALDLAASAGAADDRTLDQRRFDSLVDLCADSVTGADEPRHGSPRRRGMRPTIYLYGDVRTWAGLADLPFDLDGHGPIPAGLARAMFADAAFRVVVTDAVGTVQAVSEKQYVPSPRLRRHLHVADRTCGFPGCGAGIWFCDVEHSLPHDQGGGTDSDNCGLVCRRHHRLKTFGGWGWRRDPVGRTVWTSPDGHTFHRDPVRYLAEEAEAEALRRLLHERPRPAPPLPVPPLPDDLHEPPPF